MIFNINRPFAKDASAILWITSRFGIVLMKSFDSLAVDIFKGLHFFFTKNDGVSITVPSRVELVNGCYGFNKCRLSIGLDL